MGTRRVGAAGAIAAAAVLVLTSCQSSAPEESATPTAAPAVECESGAGFETACEVQSPEDFQVIPDGSGQVLIARGNGPVYKGPSGFSVLDPDTLTVDDVPISEGEQLWGEESCAPIEGPLNLHGMFVGELTDGALRVLAVNHAERESVEMFELDHNDGEYALTWRGCLEASSDDYLNDVTGLPDGSVAVSVMAPTSALFAPDGFDFVFSGDETGHVLYSAGADALAVLPGTETPTPNGLAFSDDGAALYYLQYTAKKIAKYDMAAQAIVAEADLTVAADNMSVAEDGALYTTGFLTVDDARACSESALEECGGAFGVDRIDPATLEVTALDLPTALPVRSATVAVAVDQWMLISSTATDSIVRIERP